MKSNSNSQDENNHIYIKYKRFYGLHFAKTIMYDFRLDFVENFTWIL